MKRSDMKSIVAEVLADRNAASKHLYYFERYLEGNTVKYALFLIEDIDPHRYADIFKFFSKKRNFDYTCANYDRVFNARKFIYIDENEFYRREDLVAGG